MGPRAQEARAGPQGDVQAAFGAQAVGEQHGAFVDEEQAAVGGFAGGHCRKELGCERRGSGSDLHALPSPTPHAHSRWSVWAWVKPSPRRPKMPLHNPVSTLGAGNGGTQLGPPRMLLISRDLQARWSGHRDWLQEIEDPGPHHRKFLSSVVQLLSCVRLFGTP